VDERYRIEIEHDGECWTVSFPKLSGCFARAYDLLEAISAAEFAQEDYLGRFADAERWGEKCD
jgi:predicted RNase H-like HicB family nuclease